MEQNLLAWTLVGLVCMGMGAAFFVADRATPTSRALALAFDAIGISAITTTLHFALGQPGWMLVRVAGLFDAVAFVAVMDWILRVRRTVPAPGLETRSGDTLVRWGQAAGVFYGVAALAAPQQRMEQFLNAAGAGGPSSPWFWVFAVPLLVAAFAGVAALLLLLNRKPDAAERHRVVAMVFAIPLLGSSLLLPEQYAPVALLLGALVFLIGAVQYHVDQGRRGEFMAQFLSPQVANLVRRRGMAAVHQNRLDITVVVVDLRGFTAFTAHTDSATVMEVLCEYYCAVGDVVKRFGGTIKDQAGDGVLILVGAPVEDPLHRRKALEMARALAHTGRELGEDWRARGLSLGVGIGVASGPVTVGVIGIGSRMEYTAVGPAVNLAARLCQHAGHGEVLVAPETVDGEASDGWQPMDAALELKGLDEPVRPVRLLPA